MVTDQGQIGVLDPGDVFTIEFQRPVDIFAPNMGLHFQSANGEQDMLDHPISDFGFSWDRKSITVTINAIDLGGGLVEFDLPLPVTLTRLSGAYDRRGDLALSSCSRDVILD